MSETEPVPRPESTARLVEASIIPDGTFPLERLRDLWEEEGPEIEEALVAHLEWLATPGPADWERLEEDETLHYIACYLLADRGSPRLFEPLVAILKDDDSAEGLFGDVLFEDAAGWLTVSGTPGRLREILKDASNGEWLRANALTALGAMAWDGNIPREEHYALLAELPHLLAPDDEVLWDGWMNQIAFFQQRHLLEMLRGRGVELFDSFEDPYELIADLYDDPNREETAIHSLFTFIPGGYAGLDRMAEFDCFKPDSLQTAGDFEIFDHDDEFREILADIARPREPDFFPTLPPLVREEPKIHRNDPCPCGSGRKYKKCCGK